MASGGSLPKAQTRKAGRTPSGLFGTRSSTTFAVVFPEPTPANNAWSLTNFWKRRHPLQAEPRISATRFGRLFWIAGSFRLFRPPSRRRSRPPSNLIGETWPANSSRSASAALAGRARSSKRKARRSWPTSISTWMRKPRPCVARPRGQKSRRLDQPRPTKCRRWCGSLSIPGWS